MRILGAVALLILGLVAAFPEPSPALLHYPVALALTANGRWLFTANQRSGTISVIDTDSLKSIGDVAVGRKLADITLTPDGKHLLAVDEDAHELIVLARRESALSVVRRVPVPPGAVCVRVSADGARCFVTSVWQRRLADVDLATYRVQRSDLPLAPRLMLQFPESDKLLVADAFGGQLALFDSKRRTVESLRQLPAHNIRGLALSPDRKHVLVAHQVLHRLGETTRDNVHWGNVITNNLRVLQLDRVLDARADLLDGSRLHQLGEAGRGSGDPAGVVAAVDSSLAVTLSGVGQIAVGPDRLGNWDLVKVGSRPHAMVASADGRLVYVANTFSDSISVVDVQARFVQPEISLGTQPSLSARERGERLFYDARLSHDGWMSCHSCHTDGHSNRLLSDTLGDGSFGAPKRVLSLLGVKDTAPYAWNGGIADLESQIRKSVATTMHGPKLSDQQVADLAAYLRALAPPPSPEKHTAEQIGRGRIVYEKQRCATCHAPPTYTSEGTYDVDLKDETGNRHFNPPSLRGLAHGGPFFHDGRAATLEEVFTKYGHQLKGELPAEQLRDLLAFLRSL